MERVTCSLKMLQSASFTQVTWTIAPFWETSSIHRLKASLTAHTQVRIKRNIIIVCIAYQLFVFIYDIRVTGFLKEFDLIKMHIGKMSLISIIIHGYFNCTLFFYRYLTVLQSRCVQHILNNLDEMAWPL